ncbi:peptidase inhibitor family I36 protein [Nonomuraea sp. B10E15]|uniref:peptidase inhibitor family I36 protein n=1 Tax=Nonomuraea sp. B10E15 TaxID=3153560 RepID=UPI00325DF70C
MKRIARCAASVALAAAGLLGSSATAQAAIIYCKPGDICLFEHTNFEGYRVDMQANQEDVYSWCRNLGAINNEVSSMKNASIENVWFFDGRNCTGTKGYVALSGSEDSTLSNNGWNDRVTSIGGPQ